jgi:aminoglycoside 2'-N-acetyltransferase I
MTTPMATRTTTGVPTGLAIDLRPTAQLQPAELDELRALCAMAYDEDFSHYFEEVGPGVHLIGRLDGQLVAHAMWVTRMLAIAGCGPLRTAYVEAVATRPAFRRRGFAGALLARLAREIGSYDLAALSPSGEGLYQRQGWLPWRGPLFIRDEGRLIPTPDERVMILRLPGTPADLDLDAAMSAEWRRGELW